MREEGLGEVFSLNVFLHAIHAVGSHSFVVYYRHTCSLHWGVAFPCLSAVIGRLALVKQSSFGRE